MEGQRRQEREIYWFFRWSVFLKGVFSLFEVNGGVLVLAVPGFLLGTVISLSQDELLEEPGDFIATHALQFAQHFSVAATIIIGVYLLSRGLIKLGLVVALLKNKLWAYPASLLVLGLFVVYQTYEIIIGHSLLILALTLFDLVVLYLIWKEYAIVRQHLR